MFSITGFTECAKYHDFDYTETYFFVSVVGGEDATAREFPHMAALGYGDQNNIQWNCGGTLISEQHVVTAAHCVFSKDL